MRLPVAAGGDAPGGAEEPLVELVRSRPRILAGSAIDRCLDVIETMAGSMARASGAGTIATSNLRWSTGPVVVLHPRLHLR